MDIAALDFFELEAAIEPLERIGQRQVQGHEYRHDDQHDLEGLAGLVDDASPDGGDFGKCDRDADGRVLWSGRA